MSQKTLLEIYTYIQRYLIQKNTHPNYIDYYDLYQLDPNSNIETLKSAAKKIKKLFHPDQKIYIDNKYGFIYDEVMMENNKFYNAIESEKNKTIYDNDLRKQSEYFTRSANHNDNNFEKQNNEKNQQINTKEILKILERITETMIYKYNFSIGYRSLEAATEGDYKKVTRENNCRQLLTQIDKKNIQNAIQSININNNNFDDNLLEFYNSIIKKPGIKEKTLPFYNACIETAKKYGSSQLSQALNFYIREKITKFFTNDHNVRVELENADYPKEDIAIFIYSYLYDKGYNLTTSQELSIDEILYIFSEEIINYVQKAK